MDCPPRLIAIAQALLAQNVGLLTGSDDQSRLFIRLVAEQAAFELGPAFGLKSAGPGRPQGPSQIAYTGEAQFGGWRVVDAGRVILPNPPWQSFADQVFIRVDPIDHLKISETGPPPRSDPQAPPVDVEQIAAILARLDTLERIVTGLAAQLPIVAGDAQEALHRKLPRYVGKFGPFTLVSVPEGQ
jgi:hypothetical protein